MFYIFCFCSWTWIFYIFYSDLEMGHYCHIHIIETFLQDFGSLRFWITRKFRIHISSLLIAEVTHEKWRYDHCPKTLPFKVLVILYCVYFNNHITIYYTNTWNLFWTSLPSYCLSYGEICGSTSQTPYQSFKMPPVLQGRVLVNFKRFSRDSTNKGIVYIR